MKKLMAVVLVAGCASSASSGTASGGGQGGGAGTAGGGVASGGNGAGGGVASGDGGALVDPLAPLPDGSLGLTNVSSDLNAILEDGQLAGACDRYFAGAGDDKSRLLCGKSMFFYESFGTTGVPASLVQFLAQNFPNEVGAGFAQMGMVADPTSSESYPLGLAPTTQANGADALAFTCASCHFAKLPDGRYAVGAPNHAYDYGKQVLSLMLVPSLGLGGSTASHDPDAVAAVQPILDAIKADATLSAKLLAAVLPLAGAAGSMPTLTMENEHHYATWLSGTMDFLIQPLPIDDTVHTISKIAPLWSLAPPDELAAAGLDSAWLGWTGGTTSVMDFLHGFVGFGGGPEATWTDAKLQPLADYVFSLRPPSNPSPPDAALVAQGLADFYSDGCIGCHAGPRGSGTRLYDFSEVGTDDALRDWLDPSGMGVACCNLPADETVKLT
ncbi:MAG TPA: hypothetical protein VIA18_29645, partial [Polyangia bacterium]|nr:hypothetical protein [Polyangia bacterium]